MRSWSEQARKSYRSIRHLIALLMLAVPGACGPVGDATGLDSGIGEASGAPDESEPASEVGEATLALSTNAGAAPGAAAVRGTGDFSVEITTCPAAVSANAGSSDPVSVTIQTLGSTSALRRDWSFTFYQPNTSSRQPGQVDRVRFAWPGALREPNEIDAIRVAKVGSNDWCISSVTLRWRDAVLFGWTSEDRQGAFNYVTPRPLHGPVWLDDEPADAPASFIRFTNSLVEADYTSDFAQHGQVFIEARTCSQLADQTSDPIWVRIYHDGIWDAVRVEPSGIGRAGQARDLFSLSRLAHVSTIDRIVVSKAEDGNANDLDDPWCVDRLRIKTANTVFWTSSVFRRALHDGNSVEFFPDGSTGETRAGELFYCNTICIDALGDVCEQQCIPKRQGYRLSMNADNADCASGEPRQSPNDRTCDGVDDNCSGAADEQFPGSATSCGVGVCARTGSTSCVNGVIIDSCQAGPPTGNDSDCDALDDDCDGARDEHYASTQTSCGVGACARTGVTSCVNGQVRNSCIPGMPIPEVCDVVDNDCDSVLNDGLQQSASCGLGICQATVSQTCNASGAWTPVCVPASGNARPEIAGNGLDDDCDGQQNEETIEVSCTDGHDNDGDWLVDCDDDVDCNLNSSCRSDLGGPCGYDYDCELGLVCRRARDMSGEGTCVPPSCENGIQDPGETGVDCGGTCGPCRDENACDAQCTPGESTPPAPLAVVSLASGSFQRASTATYEEHPGVLGRARAGELRWVEVDGRRMALVEGPTTNLLRQSAGLDDNDAWRVQGAKVMAITANEVTAPDGSRSAELLRSVLGPSKSPSQWAQLSNVPHTASVWLKAGTMGSDGLNRTRLVAVDGASTELPASPANVRTASLTFGGEWTRRDLQVGQGRNVWLLFANEAGWPTSSDRAVDATDFRAWGLQLEPHSFPTSLVPTTSATATRARDRLTLSGANVPGWINSGLWQVDVRPLYASSEMTRGRIHTLFSWGQGAVYLVMPSQGLEANLVAVRSGTRILSEFLTWDRGATLTLTFDAPGNRITIAGAKTGNATRPTSGDLAFGSTLVVGGAWSSTADQDAFAAFSDLRHVATPTATCEAEQNVCNASCPCGPGDGGATNGGQCAPGLVVRSDVGWHFGLPAAFATCWDPLCDGPLGLSACGTTEDRCGLCPVATPCDDDSDCDDGESCGPDNGWAFGLSGHVCWPDICEDGDFRLALCGNHAEPCGTCPADENEEPVCVPSCENKACGDDGCGGSCGTCQRRDDDSPPTDVGAMDVEVDVGIDGNARVEIPIHTLPARQGIAPNLSLSYDSLRGHGPLGIGWGLNGLSQITRCPHTGTGAPTTGPTIDWDFCLDGQRLVPMARRYNVPVPELDGLSSTEVMSYRVETDPSVRVDHVKASYIDLSTRDIWFASYRDGRRATFEDLGVRHARARQTGNLNLPGASALWFLTRVEDTFGNYYTVDYTVVSKRHGSLPSILRTGEKEQVFEVYPKKISFTGHSPTGLKPTRSVHFEFSRVLPEEQRGDLEADVFSQFISLGGEGFRDTSDTGDVGREPDGVLLRTSKQLSKVTLQIGDSKVLQYRLSYGASPETGRPRLQTVRECMGARGTDYCKPPVFLTWSDPGERAQRTTFTLPEQKPGDPSTPLVFRADVDGDGRSELLFRSAGEIKPGIPGGFYDDWGQTLHIVRSLDSNPTIEDTGMFVNGHPTVIDFNRDGRDDVMFIATIEPEGTNEHVETVIMLESEYDPDGFTYKRYTIGDIDLGRYAGFPMFGDLNGDSFPDLLYCTNLDSDGRHGTWHIREANADSFGTGSFSRAKSTGFGCVSPGATGTGLVPIWQEGQFLAMYNYVPRVYASGPLFMDFDGDGQPEMVWKDGSQSDNTRPNGIYRYKIDGGARNEAGDRMFHQIESLPEELTLAEGEAGLYMPIDLNGDGLLDLLFTKGAREDIQNPLHARPIPEGEVLAFINNGRTLLPPTSALTTSFFAFANASGLDWNGDGKPEMVLPVEDEDKQAELRLFSWKESTGRLATFGEAVAPHFTKGNSLATIVPVAVNLSGVAGDFVVKTANTREMAVYARQPGHADLVERVAVGVQRDRAITHRVTYSTTDDPDVYEFHNPIAEAYACHDGLVGGFPFACVRHSTVVKSTVVETHDGIEEHTRENYFYRNGRSHLHRRAFFGFDQREIYRPALDARRVETFDTSTSDGETGLAIYRGMPVAERNTLNEEDGATAFPGSFDTPIWTELTLRDLGHVSESCAEDLCGESRKTFHVVRARTTQRDIIEQRFNETDLVQSVLRTEERDGYGNVTDSRMRAGREVFAQSASFEDGESGWGSGIARWAVSKPSNVSITGCMYDAGCTSDDGCPARCDSRATSYQYDGQGHLESFASSGLETTFEYDSYGNIEGVLATGETHGRAPSERASTLEYDAPGEKEFIFAKRRINALGQLTRAVHHSIYGTVTEEEFDGLVSKRELDGFGRVINESVPLRKEETAFSYDAGDDFPMTTVTVKGGRTQKTLHDSLGRRAEVRTSLFRGSETTQQWSARRWTFEEATGHLESVSLPFMLSSDPDDSKLSDSGDLLLDEAYTYDNLGRPESITHQDGSYRRIEYMGNQAFVVDERGVQRDFFMDHGRVVRIVEPGSILGPPRRETRYDYGPFGALSKIIDAEQNETLIQRDAFGRVLSVAAPGQPLTVNTYNAFGELETVVRPADDLFLTWSQTFERDALGRVTKRIGSLGQGETRYYWDTAENGLGSLHYTESESGVVDEYTYDTAKRVASMTTTIEGRTFSDAVLARDNLGRVTRRSLPKGPAGQAFVLRHAYDEESGRLDRIYRVDPLENESLLWQLEKENVNGSINQEKFGNGLVTTWNLDPNRLFLQSIRTAGQAGTVQDLRHVYDVAGNLTDREDHTMTSAPGGYRREHFGVDAYGRIDSVTLYDGNGQVERNGDYDYDALGNLIRHPDDTGFGLGEELRYEDGLRPYAATSVPGRIEIGDIEYDRLGRLVRKDSVRLAYDNNSLPTRVWDDHSGKDVSFTYSSNGELRRSSSAEGTTYFVGRSYELHVGGDLAEKHRYHVWSDTRAVATLEWSSPSPNVDNTRYLHADHLGSVVRETDESGRPTKTMSYDPFGRARDESWQARRPTPDTSFGFTSHSQSDLSRFGLLRAGVRIYDPDIGRFYQPDPIVSEPLDGQDLNLYSYVRNRPLSMVDPSGREEEVTATAEVALERVLVANSYNRVHHAAGGRMEHSWKLSNGQTQRASIEWELAQTSEVAPGPKGTDPEPPKDDNGEQLEDALIGLGTTLAWTAAESLIPGVGIVTALDTLTDNNASTFDRAMAALDVVTGVLPMPKAGALIKGAIAVAGAAATVVTVVIKNRKAASRLADVGSTVASKLDEAAEAAEAASDAGKTLVVPKEKASVLGDYVRAAEEGRLVRTDPKTVRGSGFRKRLTKEQGPPPGSGFDADHKVELCVGGADCARTNGQWLESGPNRAAGAKIKNQVHNDALGTRYNRVELEDQ